MNRMKRLRRPSLLVAFSLLDSAATANAVREEVASSWNCSTRRRSDRQLTASVNLTTDSISTTFPDMAKKARTQVVPVRFTPEEHQRVARAADRINASMSDYLRAAALIYTEIRWRPIFPDVLAD